MGGLVVLFHRFGSAMWQAVIRGMTQTMILLLYRTAVRVSLVGRFCAGGGYHLRNAELRKDIGLTFLLET